MRQDVHRHSLPLRASRISISDCQNNSRSSLATRSAWDKRNTMISARYTHSREKADLFGLVLASQGIDCDIQERDEGFDILVDDDDHEKARTAIRLYIRENRTTALSPSPFAERFHKTYSGLFAAILICVVHAERPPGPYRQNVIDHYGASASAILNGDIYRTVTALFFHADDIHLAGNMAGLVLFGTSVASITGTGLGWFLILLSGMMGNGLNALFFKHHHLSIGASTAIFGAVGILAGYRCIRLLKEKGTHLSVILPLGAGLALLALLGASAHSDLTAHLFGYASGLVCGAVYARWATHSPREWIQALFLILTAAIIILSFYS